MHLGLLVKLKLCFRGTWVAQTVKCLTLAQVTISWFMNLNPKSGSVLTVWSLEPASDSLSPSLSDGPPLEFSLSLSLSLSLKNKQKKPVP